MGAAFSRSKPESAAQAEEREDASGQHQDGRAVEATEVPELELELEQSRDAPQAAASAPATATDVVRQRTDVFIPADIAMILDSGLHRDPDNDEDFATAKATAPGQSIQDAVREFKEKYRINMGMGDGSAAAGAPAGEEREDGELEDVRAELEKREGSLKARLAALRQRQQQQRQQAGSSHATHATAEQAKATE